MPAIQRTTVVLPREPLAATDKAIGQGAAWSRNDFIARALTHDLDAFHRRQLDEVFGEMADDPDYR